MVTTNRCSIGTRCILTIIKIYRLTLSFFLGGHCRFYPSCSAYGEQAVIRFGALKGSWLILKRLSCCHPFHPGGIDPVPLHPANRHINRGHSLRKITR